MGWTVPTTRATSDLITAAIWNTDLVDDLKYIIPQTPTTYVPALTAVTTNPTLGSGSTATGRYVQIGKLVFCYGTIVFGSGMNQGSGDYRISLPVNQAAANGNFIPVGTVRMWDASASQDANAVAVLDGVNHRFKMNKGFADTSTGGGWFATGITVGSDTPVAWAQSDEFHWAIVYEAA